MSMPAPTPASPLTPGAYLKARRCAAGLSIADVVSHFLTAPRWGEQERTAWIKLIEAGVQPVSAFTLDALDQIFEFDRDVLAELDAIRLGALAVEDAPAICRSCACTEFDPCWTAPHNEPCAWAEPDLCTACHHPAPAAIGAAA